MLVNKDELQSLQKEDKTLEEVRVARKNRTAVH